ncbi:hypothetical protein, partial [Pseudomonas syringae]|uniref:hypothetical protein n=1 Tax=Pseudomonas syringae TaxID=317 RepID=UPI001E2C0144
RLHHLYTLLCESSVKRKRASINIFSIIIFIGIFFPYRHSSAGTLHRRVGYSRRSCPKAASTVRPTTVVLCTQLP